MASTLDLTAYFERIGYRGPSAANLNTLNAIVAGHVQRIPFENLDVLLNRPISLELPDIVAKLVHDRRGGYCFEHNTLLLHVLEALGFEVSVLSARSRYQLPPSVRRPRTHVLLRVELQGESYLVDGGFGGLSPTAALRLTLDVPQETPHEPRRIVAEGNWKGLALRAPDAVLVQQAYFADAWHDLFEFTLEPMPLADREMANWYTSASPRSHFRDRLMVARATAAGRVTLQDLMLTERQPDGTVKSRPVESRRDLLATLAEYFHLVLPEDTRFDCPALAPLEDG